MAWGRWGNQDACKAKRKSAQTLSNSTWTFVAFTSKDYDTANMFAATDTKITIKTAGIYQIVGAAFWASNTSGFRGCLIEKNAASATSGTLMARNVVAPPNGFETWTTVSWLGSLAVNDTVHLTAYQNSGGNLDLSGNTEDASSLAVVRLRGAP